MPTVYEGFLDVVVQERVLQGRELPLQPPQVALATASALLSSDVHEVQEPLGVRRVQLLECPACLWPPCLHSLKNNHADAVVADVPSESWHRRVLGRCEHLMPFKQVGGMLAKVAERQRPLYIAHGCWGLST